MPDPRTILHPVDDVQLSAYYDDALDDEERRFVAAHLERCERCRARLAEYVYLSAVLRAEPEPIPPRDLDVRVERLLVSERWSPWKLIPPLPPFARSGLVATALVTVLVVALFFGQIFGTGPVAPNVAQAYPCDNASQCAIAVRFNAPVDRAAVERSVKVDPPVPVILAWQGDTLLVKPSQPLKPAEPYTVSLGVVPSVAAGTPVETAKVAVKVVSSQPDSPVAVVQVSPVAPVATSTPERARSTPTSPPPTPTEDRPASPTAEPVTPTSAPILAPRPPTSTPTPVPPRPSPTASPCPATLAQGSIAPSAASLDRLGCATGATTSVDLATQAFEHGQLVWRADRHQIVAFVAGGNWTSYPDDPTRGLLPGAGSSNRFFGKFLADNPQVRAALGASLGPEVHAAGTIEAFQHGTLIWPSHQTVLVLIDGGAWDEASDTTPGPEGTTTATPTPTSIPPATATPITPTPTATPGPEGTPVASTPLPSQTASPATPSPTASSPTPTATASPPTATPSPEGTPSGSPVTTTPGPAGTATVTPTAVASASPISTGTPLASPTPDVTPTPTQVATATPGPPGTPTPTETPCSPPPLRAVNAPPATAVDPTRPDCAPSTNGGD